MRQHFVMIKTRCYLSEGILDECLVGDQIKEADSRPVERQDVLRGPEVLEFSVHSANL